MSTFDYRRKLTTRELMPAIGAAAGVGLGLGAVVLYLGRIILQRTPLDESTVNLDRIDEPEREHR